MMLFGPGVIDETKEKTDRAKNVVKDMAITKIGKVYLPNGLCCPIQENFSQKNGICALAGD